MGFNYSSDWRAGFVMDPSAKQRVGYLTCLTAFETELEKDIEVFCPANIESANYGGVELDTGESPPKVTCAGVIESFSFNGGVGDPLIISAYISADNAALLAGKLETTLKTTLVDELGWWFVNFDDEKKIWFEEAFPKEPETVNGQINAVGGTDVRFTVASEATKIAENIDNNIYNVYFEVVPAANSTHVLQFASSSQTPFTRAWGLKVGSKAA